MRDVQVLGEEEAEQVDEETGYEVLAKIFPKFSSTVLFQRTAHPPMLQRNTSS
jgi:hypothetical protein